MIKGLVDNNKISEEEGRKVIDDLISDLEGRKEEFESRISNVVNKVVNAIDTPRREDFSALKSRIKELEAQLEAMDAPVTKTVKKVTRKAVAKKPTTTK